MIVVESLKSAGGRLGEDEASHKRSVEKKAKTKDGIDRLIFNHAKPATEVAQYCGVSKPTLMDHVKDAVNKGLLDEIEKIGNQYKFTIEHTHALMDMFKQPKWSDTYTEAQVIIIESLKGGTGKSNSCISLAASLALDYNHRPRTLVIDLDPQGSQSQFANIDVESDGDILTAVDLMLGDVEEDSVYQELVEEGFSHEEIVLESLLPTHIPNLKILPAFSSDERFNSMAWNQQLNTTGGDNFLELLKIKVVNVLKEHFDIILIDTAPQLNPLVWSALESANGLLVPCTPHALDWKSTQNFLKLLPETLEQLPSKGENLKWWKVLATNFDDEHDRDIKILKRMQNSLGSDLFYNSIVRSVAFEQASQNYRTVLDLKKVEKWCPDLQIDKALSSLNAVSRELVFLLNNEGAK